jgi:hypothetical protein
MRSYGHFVYRLTPNINSFGWSYVQGRTDVPAVVVELCVVDRQLAVDASTAAELLRWMTSVGWAERHAPVFVEPFDGAAPVDTLRALSIGPGVSESFPGLRLQTTVTRLAGLRLWASRGRASPRGKRSMQSVERADRREPLSP